MANWVDPSTDAIAMYQTWLAERPPAVREVAARFPPWGLYRMKDSGHRVVVHSFQEHKHDDKLCDCGQKNFVTMTVDVLARFNFVLTERRVFGVDPDNLEPCELPAEGELLGSLEIPLEFLAGRMKIEDDE